jgi:hypothetical protein
VKVSNSVGNERALLGKVLINEVIKRKHCLKLKRTGEEHASSRFERETAKVTLQLTTLLQDLPRIY